jgi:hypothetical protein
MPAKRYALGFALLVAACGAGGGSDDGAGGKDPNGADKNAPADDPNAIDPAVAAQLAEKPWEVVSKKGETYLPDVFYADAPMNEQIMPYALDGHVMIDRLVYPTLGNPNLYTKSDATDEFMMVLRIEDGAYDFLGKAPSVDTTRDMSNGFAFFLIPRSGRDGNTESTSAISSGRGTDVIRIFPNDVKVNDVPADLPDSLKARKTVRFVFDQGAMSKVPAGLYDVRFEMRQSDSIYKSVYEYQYNAVRVFDAEPEEHTVINVTDTQVSVGDLYHSKTKDRLDQFVQFLNTSSDPNVRAASFITFNGDLHNGGSPGSLRQRTVATTYNEEAKAIVASLKYLPFPIFLTVGNHDGYVSTGQVPGAVVTADDLLFDSLDKVINDANPKAWPGFQLDAFHKFLDATSSNQLGGKHVDTFDGRFGKAYKELPADSRNYILYDGFHQWKKTYGPLAYSWKFGKSFYVSLNSFELRQHRRTGWGMYTVNYGGAMTDTQMEWLDRELLRAKTDKSDVVLLAHHDPRGGHKGEDLGYYFDQLDYESIYQSAINYLVGKAFDPIVCKLPDWSLPRGQVDSCMHDGLQEWMRPDPDFDGDWMSGVELMKRFTGNPTVRTVILGHTHYNSLEVLQTGDELLPGQFKVDESNAREIASREIENPVRGYAVLQANARIGRAGALTWYQDYDANNVPMNAIVERAVAFGKMTDRVFPQAQRVLDAPAGMARELVVLRLVSNADLASQTVTSSGNSALGFGVLHVTKKSDARAYDKAQINSVTFFVNSGANIFDLEKTIDLDRTKHLAPHDQSNPIQQIYSW